jgi:hypothetical protein
MSCLSSLGIKFPNCNIKGGFNYEFQLFMPKRDNKNGNCHRVAMRHEPSDVNLSDMDEVLASVALCL